MNYETSLEIEIAVANWFGIRTHIIVPNLSWAFMPYECDLVVLTKVGYLYEVEIKVSRSDLIRDKKKYKWAYMRHRTRKIWFAIPEKLAGSMEYIPQQAGVFIVDKNGHITELRKPEIDSTAQKLSDRECFNVARLGAMRIWSLKKKLIKNDGRLEPVRKGENDVQECDFIN